MNKNVFDKDIVNEQLVILSDYLDSQRTAKKTLLSYLEKVSEYITSATATDSTEAFISCLSNIQTIFDNIKNNTDKLVELKLFIENIRKSSSLKVIDLKKYRNQFIELDKNIRETNTSYNNFMDTLTSISLIDFSDLQYTKLNPIVEEPILEENSTEYTLPQPLVGIHSLEAFEKMIEELSENDTEIIIEDIDNSTDKKSKTENTNNEGTSALETLEETLEVSTSENNYENVQETVLAENFETTLENIETNEEMEQESSVETANEIIEDSAETIDSEENPIESNAETIVTENENNIDVTSTEENINEKDNNSSLQQEIPVKESVETTNFLEKTLYINYDSNYAILPYSLLDLDKAFSEHPEKYSSINDIIAQEYTVSLDTYSNTSISRFKHTFKLAKDKSKLSFFKALGYANRFLFESEVEPIIIAACETIYELDCYLEYLNNDDLDRFNCFNIIDN